MASNLTKTALALVALGFGTAALAAPDGHGPRFPISIAQVQAKADERFAAADTDSSGGLSMEEFATLRSDKRPGKRRHQLRKHRHGGKHRAHQRDPEAREAFKAAMQEEVFALMDTDSDGAISRDEHNAADMREIRKTAGQRVRFAQLDADGDGQLTREELPNRIAKLSEVDSDNDGLVTKEEMRAARDARRAERRANASG